MYCSKNQMWDFSSLRFISNLGHARRLSCLIKPQASGTTGPPSIYYNRARIPGKNITLRHVFFLSRSVEFTNFLVILKIPCSHPPCFCNSIFLSLSITFCVWHRQIILRCSVLLKTLAVEGAELVTSIMLNYLLNAIKSTLY